MNIPSMNFSSVPIGLLMVIGIVVIFLFIEFGFRFGKRIFHKQNQEKDFIVSSLTAIVLSLIAFILAFTFNIVSSRYDYKKALVREEANAIRTVWFRSSFLPDSDQIATKKLLVEYVDVRLAALKTKNEATINASLDKDRQIQDQLWEIAVANGQKNMNSDVGALYVEALNEMIAVHYTRVIVSLFARVPLGIWLILIIMVPLGMMLVGYTSGLSGSGRSWVFVIVASTFALVLGMVYTMDKLYSPFTPISQFAMEELLEFMKSKL